MNNSLQIFNTKIIKEYSVNKILQYNNITNKNGLILTKEQAMELVETKNNELKNTGRIEFRDGIIQKLIKNFYNSPYINKSNYQSTLCSLVEIFYYYKNETYDQLSDDELIDYMNYYFNGSCHGSIELLACRELDQLARNIRNIPNDDVYIITPIK